MAHIAMARVSDEAWRKASSHIQFGPAANLETAIHTICSRIEVGQHAMLVDCANAFNTVSRDAIVEQLKKNPGFWSISSAFLFGYAVRPLRISPTTIFSPRAHSAGAGTTD